MYKYNTWYKRTFRTGETQFVFMTERDGFGLSIYSPQDNIYKAESFNIYTGKIDPGRDPTQLEFTEVPDFMQGVCSGTFGYKASEKTKRNIIIRTFTIGGAF